MKLGASKAAIPKTRTVPRKKALSRTASAPQPAATTATPTRALLRKDDLPKPIHNGKRLMGRVQLVLDEGQTTDVLGICYGLEHEISAPGYRVKVFLDYYNRRLKVMDYRAQDYGAMVAKLAFLAEANKFDKVWIKADQKDWQQFLRYGYVLEGLLRYANRGRTAFMMSKFRSQKRMHSKELMKEILLIEEILGRERRAGPRPLPPGYTLDFARERDIEGMLGLYRRVFKTYPSPLTYREYLTAVLHRDAIFRVIRNKSGQVVSVASAELDRPHRAAELTDCATHPDERGNGLMSVILDALENDLRKLSYVCAFTMARARSYGMNAAFHALGYEFNGRMINNCDIYGAFEDMNLWAKDLRPSRAKPKAKAKSAAAAKRAVARKPAAAAKPAVARKPPAAAKRAVARKPAAAAKPAVARKPAAAAKPAVARKPAAAAKPAVARKPAAAAKRAVARKPAAAAKPAVARKRASPALASTPANAPTQTAPAP